MKHLLITASLAGGFLLVGCTAQTSAPSPQSAQQFTAAEIEALKAVQAKSDIMQLVYDYSMARDDIDWQAYGNVFAEDGRFIFGGQTYVGPEAIGGRIKDAPNDGASIHMLGGSQIEMQSATTATGRHYVSVYGGRSSEAETEGGPIPVSGPIAMGIYTDKYKLTDNGWKISERAFQRVFTAGE